MFVHLASPNDALGHYSWLVWFCDDCSSKKFWHFWTAKLFRFTIFPQRFHTSLIHYISPLHSMKCTRGLWSTAWLACPWLHHLKNDSRFISLHTYDFKAHSEISGFTPCINYKDLFGSNLTSKSWVHIEYPYAYLWEKLLQYFDEYLQGLLAGFSIRLHKSTIFGQPWRSNLMPPNPPNAWIKTIKQVLPSVTTLKKIITSTIFGDRK